MQERGHWCYLCQCVLFTNQAISETDNRNLFLWASECFHLFARVDKYSLHFWDLFLIEKTQFRWYHHNCAVKASKLTSRDVCGLSESGKGARFKCDLVLCCRIWLHGDWERAAWRLLSFLSVRDGNTHGPWGWLPEILWRGLLPAQALQVTDHIGHRTHTRTTGERRVEIVEVLPGYCSYFSYGEKVIIIIIIIECTGQVRE